MKKYFCLLLCLLMLLCACDRKAPERTEPTEKPNVTQNTEPTEPAPTEPVSYRMEQGVTEITAIGFGSAPQFAGLGGGLAVLCEVDYESNATELLLYDIPRDTVLKTVTLEGALPILCGSSTQGFVLQDYENKSLRFMNRELEAERTLPFDGVGCAVSADLKSMYYVRNERLYRVDTVTGDETVVALPYDLSVNYLGSLSADGILTLSVYKDPYEYGSVLAALDLNTMELKLLREDYNTATFFPGGFQMTRIEYETLEDYVVWSVTNEYGTVLRQIASSQLPEAGLSLTTLEGSPYCIGFPYMDDGSGKGTWLITERDGVYARDLTQEGVTEMLLNPYYLPEEDLILTSTFDSRESRFRFLILDPQTMTMEPVADSRTLVGTQYVDQALIDQIRENTEFPAVREELQPLREKADALEEEYGVRILISNQCDRLLAKVEYAPHPSEEVWNEYEALSQTLDQMRTAMERYPEGFFRQFTSEEQGEGILVLLTGPMESDFGVIGLHQTMRTWNVITMDISYSYEADSTFTHEMWHAMEDFIGAHEVATSNLESGWREEYEACNPEGFTYDQDHTDTIWHDGTYMDGAKEIYFVDQYSCTFSHEDRARLMEYVMAYPDCADVFMQCEPMQKKLSILCREIRSAFDTTGWGDLWWERYETQE